MTVRTNDAIKFKCHTLDSATRIIVTDPMTTQIGDAASVMH